MQNTSFGYPSKGTEDGFNERRKKYFYSTPLALILRYIFEDKNTQDERRKKYFYSTPLALSVLRSVA
jgi:hypothetical protein